ncbi:MAG: HipA domain-containing protein [Puniceicoccaceae bacterium]
METIPSRWKYSETGLRLIHPKLTDLKPLPYSQEEQLKQARLRSDKMSIQGVQPKLSAVLKLKDQSLALVDTGGKFILKPNPPLYEEVPANEALTMCMAAHAGIDVPAHGLLRAIDGSWVYFIKRFDRVGRSGRVHVEDFSQLTGSSRETKYSSSLEQVALVVDQFCTFPAIERPKLAKRLLFCFLTGNEDMHLKNFSIWHKEGVTSLTPAYDFLNTTLVLGAVNEETALPLKGKKKSLNRKLWIDYYCHDRLGLSRDQVDRILADLSAAINEWKDMIDRSYLSSRAKQDYLEILLKRSAVLGLSQ